MIFSSHTQRKESAIHIHFKRVYAVSYILSATEQNECGMYMYDGFRTTVNKPNYILNCIIKEECFT